MKLTTIADFNSFLAQEKQEERRALALLRGANFVECLRLNSIISDIEVVTEKGKKEGIRGQDIYKSSTWEKFLLSIKKHSDICQITSERDSLTAQYVYWLTHDHTERYRAVKSAEHTIWLERVARLAVTRHIMENKYRAYTTENQNAFADPYVATQMTLIMMLKDALQGSAITVNHGIKALQSKSPNALPEASIHELRQMIDDWFTKHYERLQSALLLARDETLALPEAEVGDNE